MSKAEQITRQWLLHRKALIELLAKVPDEAVNYKPWNDGMTLGDLALHIATSSDWFVHAVNDGAFKKLDRGQAETMQAVRDTVQTYTEKDESVLLGLTDEQLERVVDSKPIFGFDAPGKVWLSAMKDHEVHHKGQLFVYARMVGVEEMPFFIHRG